MEGSKDVEKVPGDRPVVEQPQSAWQVVRSLIDINWWRASWQAAISFAPFCIKPAVFSALSGAIVHIAVMVSGDCLRRNPVDFSDLLFAIAALLMGFILGLSFMVLAFGGWLLRLAAYSIALVEAPSLTYLGSLSKQDRTTWLKTAIAAAEPKKVHIGGVLLWVTLYMLFPFIVVLGCTAVKMITMPSFMGAMALKLPGWIDPACAVAALPNFLFLVIFSFVSLVVAACAALRAQQAASLAFKLSWKYFWPLSIVSVFFAALSIAVGAPSDLMQMLTVDKVVGQYDPNARILSHVWSSLIGILLYPLSFTPICDILRPQLRNYLLAGEMIVKASQETTGVGQTETAQTESAAVRTESVQATICEGESETAQTTIDVGQPETTQSNVES